jgi:hypothetical protein
MPITGSSQTHPRMRRAVRTDQDKRRDRRISDHIHIGGTEVVIFVLVGIGAMVMIVVIMQQIRA